MFSANAPIVSLTAHGAETLATIVEQAGDGWHAKDTTSASPGNAATDEPQQQDHDQQQQPQQTPQEADQQQQQQQQEPAAPNYARLQRMLGAIPDFLAGTPMIDDDVASTHALGSGVAVSRDGVGAFVVRLGDEPSDEARYDHRDTPRPQAIYVDRAPRPDALDMTNVDAHDALQIFVEVDADDVLCVREGTSALCMSPFVPELAIDTVNDMAFGHGFVNALHEGAVHGAAVALQPEYMYELWSQTYMRVLHMVAPEAVRTRLDRTVRTDLPLPIWATTASNDDESTTACNDPLTYGAEAIRRKIMRGAHARAVESGVQAEALPLHNGLFHMDTVQSKMDTGLLSINDQRRHTARCKYAIETLPVHEAAAIPGLWAASPIVSVPFGVAHKATDHKCMLQHIALGGPINQWLVLVRKVYDQTRMLMATAHAAADTNSIGQEQARTFGSYFLWVLRHIVMVYVRRYETLGHGRTVHAKVATLKSIDLFVERHCGALLSAEQFWPNFFWTTHAAAGGYALGLLPFECDFSLDWTAQRLSTSLIAMQHTKGRRADGGATGLEAILDEYMERHNALRFQTEHVSERGGVAAALLSSTFNTMSVAVHTATCVTTLRLYWGAIGAYAHTDKGLLQPAFCALLVVEDCEQRARAPYWTAPQRCYIDAAGSTQLVHALRGPTGTAHDLAHMRRTIMKVTDNRAAWSQHFTLAHPGGSSHIPHTMLVADTMQGHELESIARETVLRTMIGAMGTAATVTAADDTVGAEPMVQSALITEADMAPRRRRRGGAAKKKKKHQQEAPVPLADSASGGAVVLDERKDVKDGGHAEDADRDDQAPAHTEADDASDELEAANLDDDETVLQVEPDLDDALPVVDSQCGHEDGDPVMTGSGNGGAEESSFSTEDATEDSDNVDKVTHHYNVAQTRTQRRRRRRNHPFKDKGGAANHTDSADDDSSSNTECTTTATTATIVAPCLAAAQEYLAHMEDTAPVHIVLSSRVGGVQLVRDLLATAPKRNDRVLQTDVPLDLPVPLVQHYCSVHRAPWIDEAFTRCSLWTNRDGTHTGVVTLESLYGSLLLVCDMSIECVLCAHAHKTSSTSAFLPAAAQQYLQQHGLNVPDPERAGLADAGFDQANPFVTWFSHALYEEMGGMATPDKYRCMACAASFAQQMPPETLLCLFGTSLHGALRARVVWLCADPLCHARVRAAHGGYERGIDVLLHPATYAAHLRYVGTVAQPYVQLFMCASGETAVVRETMIAPKAGLVAGRDTPLVVLRNARPAQPHSIDYLRFHQFGVDRQAPPLRGSMPAVAVKSMPAPPMVPAPMPLTTTVPH